MRGDHRFVGHTDQRQTEELLRDVLAAQTGALPHVVAKLGGLAMPDNGFGWDQRALPAHSDELVEAQGRYYRHTIECFSPERCMFESNFPVDRRSLPYVSYWNAMKKIAAAYSADEQHAMFYGTAEPGISALSGRIFLTRAKRRRLCWPLVEHPSRQVRLLPGCY